MSVAVIQGVAILIQCASAFFAIRLVRITERYTAWLLITVSIMLIVARRTISYGRLITGDLSQPPDASVMTESILLLVISIAQAAEMKGVDLEPLLADLNAAIGKGTSGR